MWRSCGNPEIKPKKFFLEKVNFFRQFNFDISFKPFLLTPNRKTNGQVFLSLPLFEMIHKSRRWPAAAQLMSVQVANESHQIFDR